MKADFSYRTGSDDFTSVYPNTPEAEREYNRIFAETGAMRLAPFEFDKFRQNARAAGYSVQKQKTTKTEISAENLASLLEPEYGSTSGTQLDRLVPAGRLEARNK
jgi:hypothetical protein